MMAIPVDVIMRSNFRETRGGDVAQIENSLAPLGDRIDARYVAATAGMVLRPDAIHHIVNVDRPLDFLAALDQCGSRVIVSAVHHALPRITAMQRAVGDDRKVGFLPSPLRERLAFVVRASENGRNRAPAALKRMARIALAPSDMWRRLGHALDSVAHVVLLAEQERADLIADTGWHGSNGIIIPNGRPPATAETIAPWHERPRGIIVVGRIEPRKRQLAIAHAAARSRTPVTFIGPVTDDSYGRQFRDIVAAHQQIEWLGARPAAETVALIATARVLLNASWVEVQSLVDIEAATAGCWVVTSPTGSSREWLGAAVDRIDNDDATLLLAQAQCRASRDAAPPLSAYHHDWVSAGEQLLALYTGLVQSGTKATMA